MADEPVDAKTLTGCLGITFWLFLTQPLWYALLFGILQKIEADPWMWTCFWIYVPATISSYLIVKLSERL